MTEILQECSNKTQFEPVTRVERYAPLDILRGLSLFGVLMVNLLTFFRVSVFQYILTFHTHPGFANRIVDLLCVGLLDTKAVTLFSFSFGVGVSIQAERAYARGANIERFLLRRFLALLFIGSCHMFLLSNVDILCLYAFCGLAMIPLIGTRARDLAVFGAIIIILSFFIDFSACFPSPKALHAAATQATRVYSTGNFWEILSFRWTETWRLMLGVDFMWLPRTYGLMLLGLGAGRGGILKNSGHYTRLLWTTAIGGAMVGSVSTAARLYSEAWNHPHPIPIPPRIVEACSYVPLALAYGAGLFLILRYRPVLRALSFAAPLGQMALTNYLTQTVVLGLLFYGYGFGLMGKLGPAKASLIGIAIYCAQLVISVFWLRRFRFGPCEWVWRSMTYGCLQPMRRKQG